MNNARTCWRGIILFLVALSAHAYEQPTHRELSGSAAEASVLNENNGILKDIGLWGLRDPSQSFPNAKGDSRTLLDLIKDGADYEDSTDVIKRPFNHFYNPLNNQPLSVKGYALGATSPDWALEDGGNITNQSNSFRDARQYFYDALTLPVEQKIRDKFWGFTFQTLGQVIHHIQDMAQPQHVRNDAHCDAGVFGCGIFFYNPSLYEKYSDKQREKGALPFAGYNPVYSSTDTAAFNSPRKLWHTADGKGIADFTNRGFVSAGTIFDSAFPSPVLDLSRKLDFDIKDLVPGTSLKGKVSFYGNTVTDNFTGVSVNNPMAVTRSIFDAELEKYATFGKKAVYTLNSFNFDVAHSLLIPRAVGYSAGLINYFFRAKIDFIEDTNNPGKYVIKNLGPEDMKGTFTLYYDAVDGKRYPVAGAAPDKTWADTAIVKNGVADNLSFTPPTDPAPASPGEYMLVFSGDMGEEKAVPGATVGAVAAKKVGTTDDFYILDVEQRQLMRFNGFGDYLDRRRLGGYGRFISGLMAYGRDTYHLENPLFSKDIAHAFKNGIPFFSEVASFNDVAGNSKEIFVAAVHNAGDPVVTVYDFAGSYLRSFTVNPRYYYQGGAVQIVANDSHLVSSDGGTMSIYDIAGSHRLTLDGWDVWESILALSKDRIYRASYGNGDLNVHVYDLNGIEKSPVPIPTSGDITCIDATDNRLYVVSSERVGYSLYKGRIHVFSRDAKNDTHLLINVADIPVDSGWYACSVDRAVRKVQQ